VNFAPQLAGRTDFAQKPHFPAPIPPWMKNIKLLTAVSISSASYLVALQTIPFRPTTPALRPAFIASAMVFVLKGKESAFGK
jgi:hypothetical protein